MRQNITGVAINYPFKRKLHKMAKHTQTIRRQIAEKIKRKLFSLYQETARHSDEERDIMTDLLKWS